ncbi:hypothetical protein [Streptomyces prasinopilosus]|uniref:Secreted protein n=1 Tax=Streptomyces prasinopilosus TaxID=67344 RepID=A0A1G6ICM7_9ACTN|nr:hypothetical protein [Streptomyces prasinopilosus]SDC04244.1 hypothetical protein SAMN05216505_101180 [Streptomyces prasinopilosus]
MRRGLVHLLAWLLATGAAVTLSWWGVHTVMAGTAYDPPRALPVTAGDAAARESKPVSSSTRRPSDGEPSKDAGDGGRSEGGGDPGDEGAPADAEGGGPDAKASASSRRSAREPGGTSAAPEPGPADPAPTGGDPVPATSGEVKAYDTAGGRAVFDLGETSASLVSATPGAGWSMQVWKTESWIRVEFTSGAERVTVFCTWHDGPPRVEIGTY